MPESFADAEEDRQQRAIVEFLTGLGGDPPLVTPSSRVFPVGEEVYKLKRARVLPFLDYGTPGLRRSFAEREVALNRRTAPALYRGVTAVTLEAAGALALDGAGEALDWLVHMRRFDSDCQADHMAASGKFTLDHATALADSITAFHAQLEPRRDKGGAAAMRGAILDIRAAIAGAPAIARHGCALADRLLDLLEQHAALQDARRDSGFVRLCHGDMHLANIVVEDDVPTPFDCIEFSDDIAAIDVLFDLAFPVMDLLRFGLVAAANLTLCRALAASADYDGLALMPGYLATRALIRAMSEGLNGRPAAADYLGVAERVLAPRRPRLIAVGGLSGSGKSSVARAVAPDLGPPPGAILLRSDEIRKRLRGCPPEQRLPQSAYRSAATSRVFARMRDQACAALAAGWTVVLDATHMDPAQRAQVETLAAASRVPFTGLWFDAAPEVLLSRVSARSGDISDAGAEVVQAQLTADLGAIGWTRIDAARKLDAVIADARQALEAGEQS